MNKTLFIIMLLSLSAFAYASELEKSSLPKDVNAFIEKRDLCDHFRGEDPYDEERRMFLRKNMLEYCSGSDQELANLRARYRNDPAVIEKLSAYEDDIEPNNDANK